MDLVLSSYLISVPYWIVILSSLLLAFAITFTVIPSIIRVSNEKGLFDVTDERIHTASPFPRQILETP